jgi:hypothetical protein
LTVPAAGTRSPFEVAFDEPIDHAMLGRVLEIRRADGRRVAGDIEIPAGETRWRFVPRDAWGAGRHSLDVETALEDLAGNKVGRPFEADVAHSTERARAPETASVPFEVRPGRRDR